MQDLLLNLLRGFGARARPGRAQGDRHRLLDYAARRGGGAWDLGDTQGVVLVAAARGKLHRRENPRSPVGEDVRFEGEICCAARKDGTPCFSDRYRGMGGWNPMGAGMAMDVLALHALKRFQAQYLQRLQGTATDSE
jgi:hypothetical protein